ncbi:hypothetical protein ACMHYB_33255 [Sorangium sp. So ce1128]
MLAEEADQRLAPLLVLGRGPLPRAAGGARIARLETSRVLSEAIGLYRAAGYREVERFNGEPYAHHELATPRT